ncbi:exopolysaccharide biosynthesis protein [Pasteurellaceae bacterium Pebbles2]|nr:exopolysaccharide biosynthesis protein [Pasteurellaceae bacterium Pebbles2]
MKNNVKVIVATHKPYEFPNVPYYVPVHVGRAIKQNDFGVLGDDTGEHISLKNSSFCELTALYWAWKNDFFNDVEYAGLVHYRRYFSGQELTLKDKKIASQAELLSRLEQCDCIVSKKRNYYIESVYEHYKNAHFAKDLDMTKDIVASKYPEYIPVFEQVMAGKTLHLFNMFVMKKEMFYAYCDWLFDILFELESRTDISNYDAYQGRVFGFISERLFNVWLVQNKVHLVELKVTNIEGENLVLKAFNLLKRKFLR